MRSLPWHRYFQTIGSIRLRLERLEERNAPSDSLANLTAPLPHAADYDVPALASSDEGAANARHSFNLATH